MIFYCSDVDDDIQSIHQFTTKLTVEAAARCIKTIDNGIDVQHKLPPSMSARFRIGTSLAKALQVELLSTGIQIFFPHNFIIYVLHLCSFIPYASICYKCKAIQNVLEDMNVWILTWMYTCVLHLV